MSEDPSNNSELTELETLRLELRELKEEIKNKPQLTSRNIAEGVAGGIMKVIGIFIMLYIGLGAIFLLAIKFDENKPSDPPTTLPPP